MFMHSEMINCPAILIWKINTREDIIKLIITHHIGASTNWWLMSVPFQMAGDLETKKINFKISFLDCISLWKRFLCKYNYIGVFLVAKQMKTTHTYESTSKIHGMHIMKNYKWVIKFFHLNKYFRSIFPLAFFKF